MEDIKKRIRLNKLKEKKGVIEIVNENEKGMKRIERKGRKRVRGGRGGRKG